jgi:hypothetical protein
VRPSRFSSGTAQTTLTLNQAVDTYTLTASFAGDGTYAASKATETFTVNKEPATLAYTGDTSLLTTATGFTLQASVTSEMDDPPGDITKAQVTFYVYPSSSTTTLGSLACDASCALYDRIRVSLPERDRFSSSQYTHV